MKERIHYSICGKHFCGQSVNFPMLIIQADSLEQMKEFNRELFTVLISDLHTMLDADNFEYVEQPDPFIEK